VGALELVAMDMKARFLMSIFYLIYAQLHLIDINSRYTIGEFNVCASVIISYSSIKSVPGACMFAAL
jgi:hypothetical protein